MHEDIAARRQQTAASEAAETQAPGTAEPAAQTAETPVEPVVDERGRKHDPATGKFLPEAGETGAPAAEGSQGSAPQGADTADKPAAEGSPERIRVEVPEGHPLRGMGLEALDASDPQQERAIRALLNSHKRTAEVEQERQQRRQIEDQLVEVQARAEVAQERVRTLISDPSLAAIYADLKQAYGEDHANRWLDGELRQDEGQIAERRQALQQQRLQQELPQMGANFREAVLSDPGQFAPVQSFAPAHLTSEPAFARVAERVSQEAVTQALNAYADHLDRTGIQDPTQPFRVEEFQRFLPDANALNARFQIALLQDADAKRTLQGRREAEARRQAEEAERQRKEAEARAEAERKAAAEEAVQQFKQQAAQTRKAQPPHPMGSLTNAVRSDLQTTDGAPEEQDLSRMSPYQLRQTLKQQARGLARR